MVASTACSDTDISCVLYVYIVAKASSNLGKMAQIALHLTSQANHVNSSPMLYNDTLCRCSGIRRVAYMYTCS